MRPAPTPTIRTATPADFPEIRTVERLAFGREDEADLVEALRAESAVLIELVAEDGTGIFGHILFSRLDVEPRQEAVLAALAPLAVVPDRQGSGIGSALVRGGLKACVDAGIGGVIVLGEPGYYGRFGFTGDCANRLRCVFSGPSFMGLELAQDAIRGGAAITYPAAFGIGPAAPI